MEPSVNTYLAVKPEWMIWTIIGIHPPQNYKCIYYIYSLIINLGISVFYPASLVINIFFLKNTKELVENLALTITVVANSFKVFNVFVKQNQLKKVHSLLEKLDKRARGNVDEVNILKEAVGICMKLFKCYATLFFLVDTASELAVLLSNERRLMYPAWFPFNWRANNLNYWIAHTYQYIGISVQILQNLANDTYPGFYICILSSHIEALSARIKKIGFDPKKSKEDNYNELVDCVKDHVDLIEYCAILQDVLSYVMLLQFFVTETVLCITAFYFLFIDGNLMEMIYLGLYFVAVIVEIALTCYYGNQLIDVSDKLTIALYSCNWTDQDEKFKRALRIFMIRTQKASGIFAGNIIPLSLATYLTVLKSAYSLYALLHRMKN